MWIREEGGGWASINVDKDFCIFKGSFGLFDAYLVVFGLFIPKTEKKYLQ